MIYQQYEAVYSKTVDHSLEVIGNNAVTHRTVLGDKSIDIAISKVEEYLKLLKALRNELEESTPSRPSELAGSSSEDVHLQEKEVFRSHSPTNMTNDSVNEEAFLADESELNGFNEMSPEAGGRGWRRSEAITLSSGPSSPNSTIALFKDC